MLTPRTSSTRQRCTTPSRSTAWTPPGSWWRWESSPDLICTSQHLTHCELGRSWPGQAQQVWRWRAADSQRQGRPSNLQLPPGCPWLFPSEDMWRIRPDGGLLPSGNSGYLLKPIFLAQVHWAPHHHHRRRHREAQAGPPPRPGDRGVPDWAGQNINTAVKEAKRAVFKISVATNCTYIV